MAGLQTNRGNPAGSPASSPPTWTSPSRKAATPWPCRSSAAFDAAAGASLGFAILSDIEAYFFINAAQGDTRSNVLQAPKVTLFNGQQAFVSDTSQTPFVISVVPVVGDFAAAQQPVIVVLSEGTFLTVQAVVSNDRRFVRLTIVPFFSKITARERVHLPGNDHDVNGHHAKRPASRIPTGEPLQQQRRCHHHHDARARRCSCRPSPS